MTIREKLYFTYDSKSSRDFGLINISLGSGMFEETLVATRNIVETENRGSDTPLFHSIDESPLEFQMALAFEKMFSDEDIDKVIVWLFQDNYKPLYFDENPNKIYWCMPVGDSNIIHNGVREGYFTLSMRCKSSKVESPIYTTPVTEVTSVTGYTSITVENDGHVFIYPEVSIEKIDDGNVEIIKNGEIFEVRNLTDKEKIYINSEKEIIQSDIIGVTRYEDVIGDYRNLELEIGNNKFEVRGTCKIAFRYKFKYRF